MIVTDKIMIDSARHIDGNGYMRVDKSNITKEQIAPYLGDSIPEWEELGLDPKKVYQIYRPAEEITKAVDSFNGLPLMMEHWDMDADSIGDVKEYVVGSLGTDASFESPYLTNSLTIIDSKAIKAIEDGTSKELSAGYTCTIDMTGGLFDGVAYDGVMRNIQGNHVALVHEGRAGHDVKVADSALKGGEKVGVKEKILNFITELLGDKEALSELMNENENLNEEVKTEVIEETKDEEPVDQMADKIRELMVKAGLDPEDKAAQKAFMAGMAVSENVEDACKDEEEPTEKVEVTEKVADSKAEIKAHFEALYRAADEVAPFIGKINNPMAFDSAADIYKKALMDAGVKLDGVDPSSYGAMVSMLQKPQAVSKVEDSEDPLNATLMGIKTM
jgi:hypothetical protein